MYHEQINLLQAMSFGKPSGLSLQPAWISWCLTVLIGLTALGVYKKGVELSELQEQFVGLQEKKAFLVNEMGAAEADMKDVVQTLAATLSKRIRWSYLMREVSLVIPEGVWTTRWESVGRQKDHRTRTGRKEGNQETYDPEIKIIGEAISQGQLTLFLSTLNRSPLLDGSRLTYARRVNGEVQFEVVVNLKAEKAP